jgi:hypothetical protein
VVREVRRHGPDGSQAIRDVLTPALVMSG